MKLNKKFSYPKPGTIQTDYSGTKTKKFLGRTTTKTLDATTYSNSDIRKFFGMGTLKKTVTTKSGKVKTKTKNLSSRRLAKLI